MVEPMTRDEFIAVQTVLEATVADSQARLEAVKDRLAAELGMVRPWPMNLTPDAIKGRAEYQAAKRDADKAFQALRTFNGKYAKQFQKIRRNSSKTP